MCVCVCVVVVVVSFLVGEGGGQSVSLSIVFSFFLSLGFLHLFPNLKCLLSDLSSEYRGDAFALLMCP